MNILEVETRPYGRPLSTVFGYTDKAMAFDADDDFDPLLPELRILSYRYVRLFFHPVKDVFVLFNGWKDPEWTDVKAARSGVDAEEKSTREVVFGSNLIDIEQKPIPKLLVDEVGRLSVPTVLNAMIRRLLIFPGAAPLLCLSNREPNSVVPRRILLLCNLYILDVCGQHNNYSNRDSCCRFFLVISWPSAISRVNSIFGPLDNETPTRDISV